MSNTYTPRADSLAAHVIEFFRANPDEHLGLEDIVAKWEATRGNIHTLLAKAVQTQLLARNRNADGDYVYSAGPKIAAAALPSPQARAKAAPNGYPSPRHLVDFDALQVEEGIPFTPAGEKGRSKWGPLFAKLAKAGQSIAIPGEVKAAVAAAALKANKEKRGTFKVAMTGPGQARIWRVA